MSYAGLSKKLANAPSHPDITEALEAFVAAGKARDKAQAAFERVDQLAEQRQAELEAAIDRVTAAADRSTT